MAQPDWQGPERDPDAAGGGAYRGGALRASRGLGLEDSADPGLRGNAKQIELEKGRT